MHYLVKIDMLLESFVSPYVYILGDFNSVHMMLNTVYLEATISSYGSPLWYMYKKDTNRKCVVAFNNIYCKKIQKGESISTAYRKYNVVSLNVMLWKSVFALRKRLLESSNILVQSILTSVFYTYKSKLTKKWNKLLYKAAL